MALPAHMKLKGDLSLREVDRRWVFHPVHGNSIEFTHEGFQEACEVQGAIWAQFGGISEVRRKQGPWWQLVTLWGWSVVGSLEQDSPFTFEKITEWVQRDLRANPKLIAAAGDVHTLKKWIVWIKTDLADPDQQLHQVAGFASAAALAAQYPMLPRLHALYARGVEADEVKRFVLRARRVIPINLGSRSAALATEVIYSTNRLVADFAIPTYIAQTLPANPPAEATPPDTTWGWKSREEDDVLYPSLAKREEVRTWVFAAWENLLYDFVA